MTMIHDARTDVQANQEPPQCGLPWCVKEEANDPLNLASVWHKHPVGDLGIGIEYLQDGGCPPCIYIPDDRLFEDGELRDSALARRIAADLIAAADLFDGVTA